MCGPGRRAARGEEGGDLNFVRGEKVPDDCLNSISLCPPGDKSKRGEFIADFGELMLTSGFESQDVFLDSSRSSSRSSRS